MAKIRTDFVTNSSSSSFVIARKKDYTKDDLKNHLLKNINSISQWVEEEKEYNDDLTIEKAIQDLIYYLYSSSGMTLGDYIVTSEEFSNEDGGVGSFIYEGNIDNDGENFKIS